MTERMNTIPPKDNNILVAVEWGNYSYWWQWSGGTIHIGGSGVGTIHIGGSGVGTIHIGGSGVGELFILGAVEWGNYSYWWQWSGNYSY